MQKNSFFFFVFILFISGCGSSSSGSAPITAGAEETTLTPSGDQGGKTGSTTPATETASGDPDGVSSVPSSPPAPPSPPATPAAQPVSDSSAPAPSPSVVNWTSLGSPTKSGEALSLSMATAGGIPYVAWEEAGKVYVAHWNGTAWNSDGAMNHPSQTASVPVLAADGEALYLAWVETGEVPPFRFLYLAKREGNKWIELASRTGSTECGPGNVDVAARQGVATVAWDTFCNDSMYSATTVNQWTGSWASTGGVSDQGEETHFADSPYYRKYDVRSGTNGLYLAVAMEDNASRMKGLQLFQHGANGWVSQGGRVNDPELFSPASFSLALVQDRPYLAFYQGALVVKEWSGKTWAPVGSPIKATADDPSLIGVGGTPYLLFAVPGAPAIDGANTKFLQVSFWNGSAWSIKGDRLNKETDATILSLSLAASNSQLYAAWIEGGSIHLMSRSIN